ncbi:MAG: PAS domain S-box protein [Syntrophales bacterium]|jgi:PAS domain S-box-containing protein|nr:PAS domain S-box protein [Syntrophales bacterium]MCK9392163.1 PAS domain S-box protein [Syntrophales bacterium]
MKDKTKTNQVLMQELASLRQMIEELKQSESELKKEKKELKKSEARFRSYFDLPLHGIAITSPERGWIQVNDRICSIMGYSRDEIVRMTWPEMTHPDDIAADLEQFNLVLSGQIEQYNMEKRFIRKDGKVIWTNLSVGCVRKPDGSVDHMVALVEDITGSKQAEETLRNSEELYTRLIAALPDIMVRMDLNGQILSVNDFGLRMSGYAREDLIGQNMLSIIAPEDREKAVRNTMLMMEKRLGPQEYHLIMKDGRRHLFEVNGDVLRNEDGPPYGMVQICRDISERKRMEKALTKSEEKFRKAFYTSPDSVNINRLEDGIYISINPGFTRITGYAEEDVIGKTSIECNIWDNIEDRQRLVAGLKKAGEVTNLEAAFRTRDGDIRYGLMSASILDLDGVPHILSITRDITDRKWAEEELERTIESLRKAFGATVQVMVSAVEARDPYTAGHQIRSANLARAIAVEMELPQDKIDGIRMAGSIHDIGKLSIPAEILSKPIKLTELEISLIKEHSRNGYEMLKDVESPWPLAQIVYQHHERMDGSGYPRNLKGDEILMEARIMAVADVVESMASHRPYRPALGIGAALEEIEKNKGTLYDNAVADACLRLFRGKGYQLEG